jgi:hypothetical protein
VPLATLTHKGAGNREIPFRYLANFVLIKVLKLPESTNIRTSLPYSWPMSLIGLGDSVPATASSERNKHKKYLQTQHGQHGPRAKAPITPEWHAVELYLHTDAHNSTFQHNDSITHERDNTVSAL